MEHEIDLEAASDKAAQLNALLFQLKAQCIDPITDNLIELAHELSDTVSVFLIEESTKGNRTKDNRDMSQKAIPDRAQLIDVLTRVKAFTVAAQYLTRDNEELRISRDLLCQAEAEIDEVLGEEENG